MMLSLIRGTTFRQRGLTNVFWSQQAIRPFSSSQEDALPSSTRLSKLISQRANLSRRKAERLIKDGEVTLAGQVVRSPQILVNWKDLYSNNTVVIKVQGKPLLLRSPANDGKQTRPEVPKVWAVHKLKGEIVSENDPHDRPSMIQRLVQGGVGRTKEGKKLHLKPIGRLDMPTEGLILVTNDGDYARKMELPSSLIHRVYRARVHGHLTSYKLDRIRRGGVRYNDVRYGPMKLAVEKSRRGTKLSTNTWVRITSTEGKNRQIRNVFEALGDYDLQTIPPGMAIQVPYKPVEVLKAKGLLAPKIKRPRRRSEQATESPVRWVRSAQ